MTVPASNPFIPTDLKTILNSRPTPGASFTMSEWQTWAGPRVTRSNYDVYQATVGARGDFNFQDITWDANYTHSRMDLLETWSGFSSISAANRLLAAADGGNSICNGGFNPFGPVSLSQSCFDYLYRVAHNTTDLVQDTAEVDLQGKVVDLPAGEMRFAAGANYRRNSYRFDADPEISTGDLSNTPASFSTRGAVNVSEVYGELLIPVLRDLPAIRDLSLDLGYRYSDYNLSGGVSTYKADGTWTIIDSLSIRGGYARATRAPSVGELFMAVSGSQVAIGNSGPTAFNSGDPCDASSAYLSSSANGANAAKVQALCVAQGAPVGFVNIQPRPSITTNGNTALEPESADTYSIGGVFRPHLDGPFSASLSLDYYDIKVSNTMGTIGAGAILWNCYNASTNPTYDINNPYCQRVSRNPNTGLISNIQNPLLNLGEYHTAGEDVQADFGLSLGSMGRLTANILLNHLDKFTIQSTPTSPALEYKGTDGTSRSTSMRSPTRSGRPALRLAGRSEISAPIFAGVISATWKTPLMSAPPTKGSAYRQSAISTSICHGTLRLRSSCEAASPTCLARIRHIWISNRTGPTLTLTI
jgi:outer membrane receptor protein involved in Fe transport